MKLFTASSEGGARVTARLLCNAPHHVLYPDCTASRHVSYIAVPPVSGGASSGRAIRLAVRGVV